MSTNTYQKVKQIVYSIIEKMTRTRVQISTEYILPQPISWKWWLLFPAVKTFSCSTNTIVKTERYETSEPFLNMFINHFKPLALSRFCSSWQDKKVLEAKLAQYSTMWGGVSRVKSYIKMKITLRSLSVSWREKICPKTYNHALGSNLSI